MGRLRWVDYEGLIKMGRLGYQKEANRQEMAEFLLKLIKKDSLFSKNLLYLHNL